MFFLLPKTFFRAFQQTFFKKMKKPEMQSRQKRLSLVMKRKLDRGRTHAGAKKYFEYMYSIVQFEARFFWRNGHNRRNYRKILLSRKYCPEKKPADRFSRLRFPKNPS